MRIWRNNFHGMSPSALTRISDTKAMRSSKIEKRQTFGIAQALTLNSNFNSSRPDIAHFDLKNFVFFMICEQFTSYWVVQRYLGPDIQQNLTSTVNTPLCILLRCNSIVFAQIRSHRVLRSLIGKEAKSEGVSVDNNREDTRHEVQQAFAVFFSNSSYIMRPQD